MKALPLLRLIVINENLEQQAQAIFKAWLVDFEPFGGVMPDDWKISNLLEIADYLNGLAMQKYRPKECEVGLPVLKIKELRQGFCDDNSELCSPSIKSDFIIQKSLTILKHNLVISLFNYREKEIIKIRF